MYGMWDEVKSVTFGRHQWRVETEAIGVQKNSCLPTDLEIHPLFHDLLQDPSDDILHFAK
jgi:hypothetical protein